MKMPGFTADTSLYDTRTSYRMATGRTAPTSNGLVEMSVNRIVGRFCAHFANRCTRDCSPSDGACRSGCNDFFFKCVDDLS